MAERNPYSGSEDFESRARMGSSDPDASGIGDEVRERASDMKDQMGDAAGKTMDRAASQANSALSGQKSRAAEGVESIANAVRQTGQQLREQDQGAVAEYAEKAATEIERFSGFLRDADVSELMSEVEGFGRRQPALFLGGAMLLGFMGARFLRSSSQHAGPDYSRDAYWRDPSAGRYGPGAGRTFAGPGRSGFGPEEGYRDPAVFRPRGSTLPGQHEEVLGPEMPSGSEGTSNPDEPRGAIRRWPTGGTPGGGGPNAGSGGSRESEGE